VSKMMDFHPADRCYPFHQARESLEKLSELFWAVLCNTIVHNHMHTDMSRSYG